MNNRFIAILIACVAIFLGLIFFTKRSSNSPSLQTVSPSSHIQGNGSTGVVMTEYGDFQCPACGAFYPTVKEVQTKYNDQIKFQFRNFPLVGLHPNAMTAHRAAEAADKQGKFWEMYDVIYSRQSAWESSKTAATIFKGYAKELGLDMDRYNLDVASSEIQSVINKDIAEGKKLNITGTPTFFIDGKLIDNAQLLDTSGQPSVDKFSALIDAAIAAKK